MRDLLNLSSESDTVSLPKALISTLDIEFVFLRVTTNEHWSTRTTEWRVVWSKRPALSPLPHFHSQVVSWRAISTLFSIHAVHWRSLLSGFGQVNPECYCLHEIQFANERPVFHHMLCRCWYYTVSFIWPVCRPVSAASCRARENLQRQANKGVWYSQTPLAPWACILPEYFYNVGHVLLLFCRWQLVSYCIL